MQKCIDLHKYTYILCSSWQPRSEIDLSWALIFVRKNSIASNIQPIYNRSKIFYFRSGMKDSLSFACYTVLTPHL